MRSISISICVLSLLTVGAVEAQSEPHQLQAPTGEREWSLVAERSRVTVEAANGARQRFRLRSGETPLRLIELENRGWLASGIRSAEGEVDLVLWDGSKGSIQRLPTPSGDARFRTAPVPVSGASGLGGMVWLEGDDPGRMSVMAAQWAEGAWSPPRVVSRPGAGSQTGLTAASRADGTWLVAWARFDGNDDEIYWAERRPTGEWTRPRAVDPIGNSKPDIAPRMLISGGETLLTWNRMGSEEYATVVARLSGSSWSRPAQLGAPGAIFPKLLDRGGTVYVLARHAWPNGWVTFELDESARARFVALSARESAVEPWLRDRGGRGLTLDWKRDRPETLAWEAMP